MKIVLEERVKHRLIGMAVILSLVAIFAPAIMKKSSQNMDRDMSVQMQLPAKPQEPKVAVAEPTKVFKTVKVAHVQLPALPKPSEPEKPMETQLAKIDMPVIAEAAMDEEESLIKPEPVKMVEKTPLKTAVIKPAAVIKKPAMKVSGTTYSVQLASFSKRENAEVLVNRLKSKGYTARITKISNKNGNQYKVYVGKSTEKEKALKLKNQIAANMQLQGFVVTGVA